MIIGFALSERTSVCSFIVWAYVIFDIFSDFNAARMGSVGAEYEGRDIPVRPIYPHPCGRTGRDEAFPSWFTLYAPSSFLSTAFSDDVGTVREKPYPEFVGCFITGANHMVSFNWIVLMIYEAGLYLL